MESYASVKQIAEGFRELTADEESRARALAEEASVIVDAYAPRAKYDAKTVVVCRMVRRAIDSGGSATVPMGASQGTTTAGPYSQSWTIGSGAAGEVYLGKLEKRILNADNRVGSYSPVQEMAVVPSD